MILVTGATGHFGQSTIDFLLENGVAAHNIVALVRDVNKAAALQSKGVVLRTGDYDNYDSLTHAFQGIQKILFISGSDIAKRSKQHKNVIEAAKETGVKHLVYTSFLRKNETETSPLWMVAQSHIQTEVWLQASGMEYTILKNNLYMDFLPGFIGENVLTSGVIYVPAGNGKVGAVLRSEMAEAAAKILTTTEHGGKSYTFTNEEAMSYQDIANEIAQVSGKAIQYISPTADEYGKTLSSYGVPAEVVGIFSSFAVAQAQGELDIVSSDLQKLLGRKPTSVKAFLEQFYAPKTN